MFKYVFGLLILRFSSETDSSQLALFLLLKGYSQLFLYPFFGAVNNNLLKKKSVVFIDVTIDCYSS